MYRSGQMCCLAGGFATPFKNTCTNQIGTSRNARKHEGKSREISALKNPINKLVLNDVKCRYVNIIPSPMNPMNPMGMISSSKYSPQMQAIPVKFPII